MNYLPYLIIVVLFVGLFAFSRRNRRRQLENETERLNRIGVGTEVMTTSGLYGTVVAKNDDGTVMLSVAPGVEIKWASAALRDASSLNQQYRSAFDRPPGTSPGQPGLPDGTVDLRKERDGGTDGGPGGHTDDP